MRDRPRVAMLGAYLPSTGGVETSVRNLMESSLGQSYTFLRFRTISPHFGSPMYFREGVLRKLWRHAKGAARFVFLLMADRPHLVHIHSSFGTFSFWRDALYLSVSKGFRKKVFYQIHGGRLDVFLEGKSPRMRRWIVRLLRWPDAISVCSEAQRQPFDALGVRHDVSAVPNAVRLEVYAGNRRGRKRAGNGGEAVAVTFIATHLFREKGILDFARSVPRVLEKNRRVRFLVVGTDGCEGLVRRYLRMHRLEGHVELLGHVPPGAIPGLLERTDLFVLPSHSEGMPMTVLEAMAAGLPVVATPVGAIPQLIRDGENGYLVPREDPVALARRIADLSLHPGLRSRMGAKNRDSVREKYDLPAVAGIVDAIYRRLLS